MWIIPLVCLLAGAGGGQERRVGPGDVEGEVRQAGVLSPGVEDPCFGGGALAAVTVAGSVAWLAVVALVVFQFRRQQRLARQLDELARVSEAANGVGEGHPQSPDGGRSP